MSLAETGQKCWDCYPLVEPRWLWKSKQDLPDRKQTSLIEKEITNSVSGLKSQWETLELSETSDAVGSVIPRHFGLSKDQKAKVLLDPSFAWWTRFCPATVRRALEVLKFVHKRLFKHIIHSIPASWSFQGVVYQPEQSTFVSHDLLWKQSHTYAHSSRQKNHHCEF